MPSACDTINDTSNNSSINTCDNNNSTNGVSSPQSSQLSTTNGSVAASNGNYGNAMGFIEEDIDDEIPVVKKSSASVDKNGDNPSPADASGDAGQQADDSFIFIQDTGFNIKISAPNMEPFDLQVIFKEKKL